MSCYNLRLVAANLGAAMAPSRKAELARGRLVIDCMMGEDFVCHRAEEEAYFRSSGVYGEF